MRSSRPVGRGWVVALGIGLVVLLAANLEAQFRRGFGNVRLATERDYDGSFHFCRVVFGGGFGGRGGSWSVDWPRADINLSTRLGELTRTPISRTDGEPNPLLVRLSDPSLFQCGFAMMTEVGNAALNDREVAGMREYLLKGGFIWADDFWGTYAWEWWEGQLRRAMPAAEFPIVELDNTHPLFRAQFVIDKTPQISSINFWAFNGHMSEQGADSAIPHSKAIVDAHGRIMILMTHNTDLGDSFEREADDPRYFLVASVPGYAYGVNTLLYTLTH